MSCPYHHQLYAPRFPLPFPILYLSLTLPLSLMSLTRKKFFLLLLNVHTIQQISVVMKSPANLRYPKYSDDQKLGLRYRAAMQRIMRESQTDK